ncbi:uncharacterized protein LOC116352637 [Contarinia nasturtii]|uniref:uncharacterized protein LOC116352637 n=1 Tax=Contarinia nasturtii TaxID=265458 RepID=UPI0012D391E8|nr:uncharacterized protein LOC116352637 [Contarinia nasturtii]
MCLHIIHNDPAPSFAFSLRMLYYHNLPYQALKNNEEHLEYGMQLWNKLDKERQILQSGSLLAMLALHLGQPNIALEILESNRQPHFIPVFIRLIAQSDCGHFAEAAQLIEQQKNNITKFHIYASVTF